MRVRQMGHGASRLGMTIVLSTCFLACTSSEPSRTTGAGGSGAAGSVGSPGVAGTGAGAGTSGSAGRSGAAGDGAAGSVGSPGVAGSVGATGAAGSPGSGGVVGTAGVGGPGTAGTTGAAGGGAAGTTGAAGAGTDGGTITDASGGVDGPNQIPSGYTGKPLGGTPQSIPGTIQIENYDLGGEGVAYHDNQVVGHGQLCNITRTDLIDLNCTGQQGSPTDQAQGACTKLTGDEYLGYIDAGDWLKYTVTVKEAGTYAISTHAGVAGNTKLSFTFTPTVKTAPLALAGTSGCGVESYHVWAVQNNIGTIALQPGTYVMQLDFVAAGLNLDYVAFTKM